MDLGQLNQHIFTNELILDKILQNLIGKDLLLFRSANRNILARCMAFRSGIIYEKLALRFQSYPLMDDFTKQFPAKTFDFARITEVRFGPGINVGHQCDSFLKKFSSNIKILMGRMEAESQFEDLLYFAHLLRNYNWDKIEEIYLEMELNSKITGPPPNIVGWKDVPILSGVKIVHLSIAFAWARVDDEGNEGMALQALIQDHFPNAEVVLTPFRTANA